MSERDEVILRGSPISKGIRIGSPIFLICPDRTKPVETIEEVDVPREVARFYDALHASRENILRLRKSSIRESSLEVTSILDTHLQMLNDPMITEGIEQKIQMKKVKVESVFYELIEEYKDRMHTLNDGYFEERVREIIDLTKQILDQLDPPETLRMEEMPRDSIILANELTPSETIEANVGAFVTSAGGVTSHAAIVARAKGIPYVTNVDLKQIQDLDIHLMIVDGAQGIVILNPSPTTMEKYQKAQKREQAINLELMDAVHKKAETIDGFEVRIFANLENPDDMHLILENGAEGVGLFRSEYLCLANQVCPSEDQQYEIYKKMLLALDGKPLVVRVFDLGGDKNIQGMSFQESNPALGCRAIRFLLKHPDLLQKQLRAILRASVFGEIHILVPMVSDLYEMRFVKKELHLAQESLQKEGHAEFKRIPIGCMIEVPSSAIMSDAIVQEADFLSIGTNDLIQYVLAADRSNSHTSDLYFTSHPSVLRLIQSVVAHTHRAKKSVILCGELAADPKLIPILLGFGIFEFSVAVRHIPLVKHTIRKWKIVEACRLAEGALSQNSAEALKAYLNENLTR